MGEWKLLLPFGNQTLVERVVTVALSVCSRVILVTGYRASDLESLFKGEARVLCRRNPAPERGMFSSVQCGIAMVDTDRLFVCLADLPLVSPEVYQALAGAPATEAIFPVHKGRRGHPVLLGRSIIDAVLRGDPETGSMREIIAGFDPVEMPWRDDTILRDVDTPRDYRRVRKRRDR